LASPFLDEQDAAEKIGLPDLHVFAKLFEDRLEWRLETEAFSRREIGSEDAVLDFFVGHFVDIDLTRHSS
jgi:hypothetical protein